MGGNLGRGEAAAHILSDGTPQVLVELARYPFADISCIFRHAETATFIWYMYAGSAELNKIADLGEKGLRDFRVQPLCVDHSELREPIDATSVSSSEFVYGVTTFVNPLLLRGAHLLVEHTLSQENQLPDIVLDEYGPHWNSIAGMECELTQPALSLGFGMDSLRQFSHTALGTLVFANYLFLLWD